METILLQQPWEAVQYLGTAGPETAESTRQVRSFRCKRTGSVHPHPVVNTVGPSNTTCNLSLKLRLRAQRKENRNKGGKTQGRGRRRERGGRKKERARPIRSGASHTHKLPTDSSAVRLPNPSKNSWLYWDTESKATTLMPW